jgi:hypothetical protein
MEAWSLLVEVRLYISRRWRRHMVGGRGQGVTTRACLHWPRTLPRRSRQGLPEEGPRSAALRQDVAAGTVPTAQGAAMTYRAFVLAPSWSFISYPLISLLTAVAPDCLIVAAAVPARRVTFHHHRSTSTSTSSSLDAAALDAPCHGRQATPAPATATKRNRT